MKTINKLLWGLFGIIVSMIYKNDASGYPYGVVSIKACANTYGDNSVCNGYGAYLEPEPTSLCASSEYYYTGKLSSGKYNDLNSSLCQKCPSPGVTKRLIRITQKYTETFCGETAPLPASNASSFDVTLNDLSGGDGYAFMKQVSQGGATVSRPVYCRYTISTSSVLASDTDNFPNSITSCYMQAGAVTSEMPGHTYKYTTNCQYK